MNSNNKSREKEQKNIKKRGPPRKIRKKCNKVKRDENGSIVVDDDPVRKLAEQVDWENLSPFEEWLVAIMEENGLIRD